MYLLSNITRKFYNIFQIHINAIVNFKKYMTFFKRKIDRFTI